MFIYREVYRHNLRTDDIYRVVEVKCSITSSEKPNTFLIFSHKFLQT